jgi:endonuclease YncB( thermonuclease family)
VLASDVAERHIDSGLEGTVAGPVDRHAPEYAQLGEDARAARILRESDEERG